MKPHLLRPLSLAALSLAALLPATGSARAALDPEVKSHYHLRVVLDVAKSRLLTPVFVDRLKHDLRDILQADLGDLAEVEVVLGNKKDPVLREVRSKGLKKALDANTQVGPGKTHYVLVNFSGGRYEIQARQHDGFTGMSSPVVRRDQTTEPQLVARKAALLVRKDFGLTGTVTGVNNQTVQLTLKGGGLPVPLDRWVKVNDIFLIAQISPDGQGHRSVPLEWAFLQVSSPPRDGVCTCLFYHRFKEDALAEQGEGAGYRCLRVATVQAPLRLRFLDYRTHAPLDTPLQVLVSAAGFEGEAETISSSVDTGVAQTTNPYKGAAFVRVLSSGSQVARLPVPMLSDRTVDVLITLNEKAEEQGQKELRRERWLRRLYDSLRVAADRVSQLNQLSKKSLAQAKELAQTGLKNMNADLQSLTEERDRLKKEEGLNLAEGDQRLEELRKRKEELERYVRRLDQIVKEEKDPKRQEMLQLLEQARLLETQAEFGKAIEIYEKILKDNPKETNVRNRLKTVEEAFAVQNQEHREARHYIYDVYPNLKTPAELEKGLKEVRAAYEVCKKNNDLLSPQKILRANVTHTANLKKRLAALHPEASEDDRKEAETIARVAQEMQKLHQEILDYLKSHKPPVP